MSPRRNIKVQARRGVQCPEVYSNYCEATHSPFDLTLTFCCLTGIHEEDLTEIPGANAALAHAEPRVRVTLPFKVAKALMSMLESQLRAVDEAENENAASQAPDFTTVH